MIFQSRSSSSAVSHDGGDLMEEIYM